MRFSRILCVYRGKYVAHEVLVSENANSVASSGSGTRTEHVQTIHFVGGTTNVMGRCFVERSVGQAMSNVAAFSKGKAAAYNIISKTARNPNWTMRIMVQSLMK